MSFHEQTLRKKEKIGKENIWYIRNFYIFWATTGCFLSAFFVKQEGSRLHKMTK